jgi:phytoene dehydrogenase-like protein
MHDSREALSDSHQFDVVVIGGGIAGTAIAAILARAELKVLLLEKNSRLGGSCSAYSRNGYSVDYGTHLSSRGASCPIGEVARRIGCTHAIEFRSLPVLMRIRGLGLNTVVPGSRMYLPLIALWTLLQTKCGFKDLIGCAKIFNEILFMSEREIEEANDTDLATYLQRRIPNPQLRILTQIVVGLFFVVPPNLCSAGEAIWCARKILTEYSIGYPRGGASRIPNVFAAEARRRGAVVAMGACITQIEVAKGRVAGVITSDGTRYRSSTVVSTLPPAITVRLCGSEHFPQQYWHKSTNLRPSLQAFQIKIGLSRPLIRAGCLIVGSPTYLKTSAQISEALNWGDSIHSGRTNLRMAYCTVPSNFDASLVPPGRQLLSVCSISPCDTPRADLQANLISTLSANVPRLAQHIDWMDVIDGEQLGGFLGKPGIISNAQVVGQVGACRHSIATPLQGLYLAGDCAGGRGIGTELAASSALHCADDIIRMHREHFRNNRLSLPENGFVGSHQIA